MGKIKYDITWCWLSILTSESNPKITLNVENIFIYKDVYYYFTYYEKQLTTGKWLGKWTNGWGKKTTKYHLEEKQGQF